MLKEREEDTLKVKHYLAFFRSISHFISQNVPHFYPLFHTLSEVLAELSGKVRGCHPAPSTKSCTISHYSVSPALSAFASLNIP